MGLVIVISLTAVVVGLIQQPLYKPIVIYTTMMEAVYSLWGTARLRATYSPSLAGFYLKRVMGPMWPTNMQPAHTPCMLASLLCGLPTCSMIRCSSATSHASGVRSLDNGTRE